jgi:hypothetical protein
MKPLFRVQMDLFASPVRRLELTSFEHQRAIALLRALLMEAAVSQAGVPASGGERGSGNE